MSPDHYIRPSKLSEELGVSESTLATWRANNEGPKWTRLGRRVIAYQRSEIDRWLAECQHATPAATPRFSTRRDSRPT